MCQAGPRAGGENKKRKEGEKERWAGLQCLLGQKKKERQGLG
jgi:hypothetical protein